MEIKKKWIGRLALLAAFLLWSAGWAGDIKAAEPVGTATVSVEKFTIGQGYLVEPCQEPIYQGDNCAKILDRVLSRHGYTYDYSGSLESGYYLKGIHKADSGVLNVPEEIRKMPSYEFGGNMMEPPTNKASNRLAPALCEFSYFPQSGWMYAVNHVQPGVGMAAQTIEDGDVLRVQFTVYGLGADLGSVHPSSGLTALRVADKDELTRKIAQINAEKERWMAVEGFSAKYDRAMAVLQKHMATQAEVDQALVDLETEQLIYPDGITLPEDALRLEIHDTHRIEPSFTPENTNVKIVSFASSDASVAEVDRQGRIIPRAAGETTITATTLNGLTAFCRVTVYKNPVPLTGIRAEDIRINPGTGKSVRVHTVPEDADSPYTLSYQSDNPAVAAVDGEGRLTGKADGSARITVTAALTADPAVKFTAQCTVTVASKAEEPVVPFSTALANTAAYIKSVDTTPNQDSQWYVIGLARSGLQMPDTYADTFYKNMAALIKEKKGNLSSVKYSEYSKCILSMTAIGKDARNIEGYNLLEKLADFEGVKYQGFNGPIWALIALNAHPEYDPAGRTTEQKLIDFILGGEISGGGWTLMGKQADVDITAMAIQALAPYYRKSGYERVTAAVDRALGWLSGVQLESGGFYTLSGEGQVENSESTAQVLTALSALGIDCRTDGRFVKAGKWPVSALLSYYKDGGFMHVKAGAENNGGAKGGKVDGMATEQAFYAMVAYQRMLSGKTALYDMRDVSISAGAVDAAPGKDKDTAQGNTGQNKGDGSSAAATALRLHLKVSKTTTSAITLKWSKVSGAKGYKVYRYDSSKKKYVLLSTLSSTKKSYVFKRLKGKSGGKLTPGTEYRLRVTAYTDKGKKKKTLRTETVRTATKPAKAAIKKLTRKSSTKAGLTWKKISKCSGYEIYMATGKKGKYKKIKTMTGNKKLSYTKTGLSRKKTYYFKVRAYKKVNGKKIYGAFSAPKAVNMKKR